ncbi:acyltransferase [Aestuariibacter halophilus]|uniref:Acyltransferase n=1 Tax=Fluctibacter halophilus TaxID=226011 RepID=A0ABS8GDH6_9ALTE|nr:acyltransferase [Aestuariibacter halophilus]MCC2617859.1 acyltransferase [Aestuariibacter halophilus]
MLSFLPAILIFPLHMLLQVANLALWGGLIILLGLVKVVLPIPALHNLLNPLMNRMMLCFGVCSVALIKLTNRVEWDCTIKGELSKDNWYLMMPNHLSWLDIILLIELAANRFPAPKFFLKKELIWVPFVGLGAWALDMPFMQRYSRAFIEKYPHLKGKDIETTRKSCEKFRETPTTVINFVEGSRYTPQKHRQRNSPFQYLLPPKAGGVAFTLAAMGELFTNILDVTLLYPDNANHPMMDMLSGRLNRVVVHVEVLPVDERMIGDYFNDETFKMRFQQWLNGLWESKDKLIDQLIGAMR